MSGFTIVPGAEAAGRPWQLILSLAGPSGSGKTYSALALATGIKSVVGGALGAIDTESGRMARYLKQFHVDWYLDLKPPFAPGRYVEAIETLVKQGCRTIIIDSLSHEHEGEGGVLEWQEQRIRQMSGGDDRKREAVRFAAWIEPKAARNKLIQRMLQFRVDNQPVNFIWCFRGKDKIALVKDDKGKVRVVEIGIQPIAGEELVFEATALLVLPHRSMGIPDWSAPATKIEGHHRDVFGDGKPLTAEMGAAMARFAAESPREPVAPEDDPVYKAALPHAQQGREAFTAYWRALTKAGRAAVKVHTDRLAVIAAEADARAKEAEPAS